MSTKLMREGRKLVVLGVDEHDMRWWHIVRSGSYNVPQLGEGELEGRTGLTVARSLCGRFVWSNGYSADFRPPEGSMCPACAERNNS